MLLLEFWSFSVQILDMALEREHRQLAAEVRQLCMELPLAK
jgi:hypothetical protein